MSVIPSVRSLAIETPRLMLRLPRREDFDAYAAFMSDPETAQAVARKLGSQNCGPGRLPAPLESVTVDIWGQTRAEWQLQTVRE